ncbi:hypothetical protein ACTFIV_004923 [Dictyostelium citrinum]
MMFLFQKDTLYLLLRLTYGFAAITSPIWSYLAFIASIQMNYGGFLRTRFQKACQLCILAEPISLVYTLYKWDKSAFVTFLPLLPLASFFVCFSAYAKDIKERNN